MSAVRREGVYPVRTRGDVQMRTSALYGKKKLGFFEIYGGSARTRGEGLNQCGQGGVNF